MPYRSTMSSTPPVSTTVQLNRHLQNHAFESWKIGSSFVSSRTVADLSSNVFQGAGEAVDFAHTRAALLCNHLFSGQGRLFTVTAAAPGGCLNLNEVNIQLDGQQARPVVSTIAASTAALTPTDAALHCSVASVATPQEQHPAAAGSSAACYVLMSSGKGDMVLVSSTPGQQVSVSAPVYPLCPRAPAVGAKPFSIAAAWATAAGLIRAVIWCLTDITAAAASSSSSSRMTGQQSHPRSAQSAWVCETWLVTLSGPEGVTPSQQQQQQQQQQQLQVLDCQLLLVSRAPPAAAVGCAAADKLLLVSEPALDDLPPGYKQQLAAVLGLPEPVTATPIDTDPAAAAAAAAAAGDGPSNGLPKPVAGMTNGDAVMDEDDDDLDPRTLAAAAARLAKYTSEAEVGDLGPQQWSDVFKETGPGELGAGGSEPAVDILLFGPSDTPSSSSSGPSAAAAAAAAAADGKFTLKCTASCGPHRLLSAESNFTGNFTAGGPRSSGLLMGVTDDVDCAVVTAAFSSPVAAAAAAAGSSSSSSSSGDLVLEHCAFLPAIAYVAAGKTQKRHLLLAPDASSPICCALVEGSKYSYLYGQVPKGNTHGQQQIVDMELPEGQSILGARLVQIGGSGSSSSSGSGAPATVLLLLTQAQLICYQLHQPA